MDKGNDYGWHDLVENPGDAAPAGTNAICRFYLPKEDKYIYGTGRFDGTSWNVTVSPKHVPEGPVEDGSLVMVGWMKKRPQLWYESKRKMFWNRISGKEEPWTIQVRSHKYIENFIDTLREEAEKDDEHCCAYSEAADELEQLLLELEGVRPFYTEEDENGQFARKQFGW